MSLSKMKKEDLELLTYTDLTELILKEKKGAMNTAAIFKEISRLLKMSDDEYTSKIGDFYTSLTTDKRFIFLDDTAEWDLRNRQKAQVMSIDDEDEDTEEVETEEEESEEEEEENLDAMESDEDDLDDDEDDIGDLAILTEDELEEDN